MSMSVGNMYNYFSSKEELAKFAIKYSTNILAVELKEINNKVYIQINDENAYLIEMNKSYWEIE